MDDIHNKRSYKSENVDVWGRWKIVYDFNNGRNVLVVLVIRKWM